MRSKKELRAAGRAARDALTAAERKEKSDRIAEKLYAMKEYREADAIAVYVSFESEVETHALIEHALQDGKRVFCPKVLSVPEGKMEFYECVTSAPLTHARNILFVVPGLAFNPDGARIGFGGGFYDRYLSRFKCPPGGRVHTVALSFACQVFEEPFPETEEDVRMQVILTE